MFICSYLAHLWCLVPRAALDRHCSVAVDFDCEQLPQRHWPQLSRPQLPPEFDVGVSGTKKPACGRGAQDHRRQERETVQAGNQGGSSLVSVILDPRSEIPDVLKSRHCDPKEMASGRRRRAELTSERPEKNTKWTEEEEREKISEVVAMTVLLEELRTSRMQQRLPNWTRASRWRTWISGPADPYKHPCLLIAPPLI